MKASQLCQRMESALKSGQWCEAMGLGERVLNSLPNHLWAQCLLGQAHLAQRQESQARACFHSVLERDPECQAARIGLTFLLERRAGASEESSAPGSSSFSQVRGRALAADYCDRAETLWRLGSLEEAAMAAQQALQIAPQGLKAALLLADISWRRGDQEEFAEWFHQAQRLDPSGVVARRVWGDQHPLLRALKVDPPLPTDEKEQGEGARDKYIQHHPMSGAEAIILPPDDPPWLLDHHLSQTALGASIPRPYPCATQDGLADGSETHRDAELVEIEVELKRIASSLSSALSPLDPRGACGHRTAKRLEAPLGLIVSNRTALEAKYGPGGASRVHRALTELSNAMSSEKRMQTRVVYLDDSQALQPYGLTPADPKNPRELKYTLNRLEERLRDGRERYSGDTHLLLIGGDDIVPFHPLADPNEDEDGSVPSDHPYACFGDNYLSFQRAVGRLPDGVSQDIGFLLKLITAATEAHRSPRRRSPLQQTLGEWLGWTRGARAEASRGNGAVTSFGYTASIWRRAAREVFSSIGQTGLLRTSPPLTAEEMPALGPIAPRFSYFNLHGLRDSAYWYGQRDPTYAAGYPLFPVAIKPDNIPVTPHPQTIVFSEACYGAHILNKHQMSSLALRFLATQALGVIGSTALAYGAIDAPLVGADLLAKAFWDLVKAGYSTGQALSQAKQALSEEMLARQGYLDAEDQKTILSFVLYGDPTLTVQPDSENKVRRPSFGTIEKGRDPPSASPQAGTGSTGDELTESTLCRRQVLEAGLISAKLMTHVQHRLASCLPSSMWKDVIVSAQTLCREHQCHAQCHLCQGMAKGELPAQAKLVFTLRQHASVLEEDVHQQIAKVTVDNEGNLLKIAISR